MSSLMSKSLASQKTAAVRQRPSSRSSSGIANRLVMRQRPALYVRSSTEPRPGQEPATPPSSPVVTPSIPAPVGGASGKSQEISLGDAMAFAGPAPEIINGRLAMLGFLAAVGAELSSGESIFGQLKDAPVAIAATFSLFAVASLIPIVKGANLKEAMGPFTPTAELINGRTAMLGLVALGVIELVKGTALF